ncbi:MAG TPA: class I SAM-dependent methyltransferase [Oscillatoriales cyanobacterium M59_W2019_021]|nr:MAG: class I SAM-dependent methyltransferase [Cyanobacteria bacterium J055]HIK31182.1 class I SAM-dependent methyltransferase [Oscillatoriales cyanobacterium M4454_W2019_049]HIK51414.1 class I SAM-dependent methyltransferase [Oscillatoriales cyanobacterium M59_W2019_021]
MNDKIKPDWAGEDFLSRVVNVLIHTKPIYAVMKQQARQVLVKTAEKNGIPWRQTYKELEASNAKTLFDNIANPHITYPDYYQVPFHAYTNGNLCWQAAFEAEPATQAMALRVWPKESLTWEAAQDRLRSSFHQVLVQYAPPPVGDILDIGCSVGLSTFPLHRFYSQRQETPPRTVGLDLSPYMLSVAKTRDTRGEIAEWRHAQAEDTGFASDSFDLVTLQFLLHELPRDASRNIFREVLRILRPGGCLAIVDNNPKSPVIQNLSPALFVLMKSTEPWSDDYYTFDVEATLRDVGFEYLTTVASDPRHRTIIAKKKG